MKKAKNNSYIGTHDYNKHKNNYLSQKIKKEGGSNE